MNNSRKSSGNLFEEYLPKPEQISNLRYSDNNNYALHSEININEVPQQLTFKNNQTALKTSNIFVQEETSKKLTFKNPSSGKKKQNTPTSTHSTQSEITLNFKTKPADYKSSQLPKPVSLSSNRKLSEDVGCQLKEIHNQSSLDPCISLSSEGSSKLQFKQVNFVNQNNLNMCIFDGSPHSQGQISFRSKSNVMDTFQQSVGSYFCSPQQLTKIQSQKQEFSYISRLQRYRKNTYKDFSQDFPQNNQNQKQQVKPTILNTDLDPGIVTKKHKSAIPASKPIQNTSQKQGKHDELKKITPESPNSSFYYHSYPHFGFINPYHKQSKVQTQANPPFQICQQDNQPLKNNHQTSPKYDLQAKKVQNIQTKIQQKLNKIIPNSQNSNFSKFKNNSTSSSGKYTPGYKEKSGQKGEIKLSDFKLGKKLGKGKFGDVFLVQNIQTRFICALKIIRKKTLIEQKVDHQFSNELKIQFYLNHPNLASLYGFFDDQTNFYMLLEYATDGHLFAILKQKKRFTEEETKILIKQVCEGVEYMHLQRILHRDLKPQNILIQFGIPKICDFGWAVYRADTLRDTFCGTPLYISPEILTGQKYDQGADLWAVGILTYELLVGKIPFKIKCEQDLIKIINEQIVFPQHIGLSDLSKDFVMRMLQRDAKNRFDIDQLLNHSFLVRKQMPKTLC